MIKDYKTFVNENLDKNIKSKHKTVIDNEEEKSDGKEFTRVKKVEVESKDDDKD